MKQDYTNIKFEQIKNFNCRYAGTLDNYKKFKTSSTEFWLAAQTDVYEINVHYIVSNGNHKGNGKSTFCLVWPAWESKKEFREYVKNLLYSFDGDTMQDFVDYRKQIQYKF